MSKSVIHVTAERTVELQDLLDELSVIVKSSPDAAEKIGHLRFRSTDLVKVSSEPASAGRAGEVVLLLEPGDRLSELVATLRAGEIGGSVVERNSHEGSSLRGSRSGCGDCDFTGESRNPRPNAKEDA